MDIIGTFILYMFIMVVIMYSYRINWKRHNWVAIILYTLLLGLRGNGIDTEPSIEDFNILINVNAGLFDESYYHAARSQWDYVSIEWFYLVIIKILKYLGTSSVAYFLIVDFIQIYAFDSFIKKFETKREKGYLVLCLFCLLFAQFFNVMRQYTAFFVYLNIIGFVVNKDWKYYFPLCALLYIFHSSSVIFLPFFFFIEKKIFPERPAVLISLYSIIVVVSTLLVYYMSTVLDMLFVVTQGVTYLKTAYLSSETQAQNLEGSLLVYLFRFSLFIYIAINQKSLISKYKTSGRIFFNFAIIGFILQELQYNRGVERLNIYFYGFVFIVLGLQMALNMKVKGYTAMKLYTVYIITLLLAWFANAVLQGAAGCAPYILNPEL